MQVRVVLDSQLVDAPEIDRTGAAISAINGVALFEQQLAEVSAILSCNAGNDRFHRLAFNSVQEVGTAAGSRFHDPDFMAEPSLRLLGDTARGPGGATPTMLDDAPVK
jgi:hypothetical protein